MKLYHCDVDLAATTARPDVKHCQTPKRNFFGGKIPILDGSKIPKYVFVNLSH